MVENDMGERHMRGGFQFSAIGAVIMSLLYLVQVTDTAEFILAPTVTLTIAIVAAIGAVLFYYGERSEM